MKIHKFSRFFIIPLVCLCITNIVFGANDDESKIDPLIRMRYKDAFDQKDIHKQYADLMRQLGCHLNVFDDSANVHISAMMPDYDPRGSSCVRRCYNKAWQAGSAVCNYAQDCIPCLWQNRGGTMDAERGTQDWIMMFARLILMPVIAICSGLVDGQLVDQYLKTAHLLRCRFVSEQQCMFMCLKIKKVCLMGSS